eukprot:IDg6240t1
MLKSQLYGQAKDLCKSIPDATIQSKDGMTAIAQSIYKHNPLSTVSEVYNDFNLLLCTRQGSNESFRNFELRYQAQLARFNSHSESCKLPDSLTAFMLLANSAIDSSQRISVLATATPSASNFDQSATTNDYLKKISYKSIATVLRQCDKSKTDIDTVIDVSFSSAYLIRGQRPRF